MGDNSDLSPYTPERWFERVLEIEGEGSGEDFSVLQEEVDRELVKENELIECTKKEIKDGVCKLFQAYEGGFSETAIVLGNRIKEWIREGTNSGDNLQDLQEELKLLVLKIRELLDDIQKVCFSNEEVNKKLFTKEEQNNFIDDINMFSTLEYLVHEEDFQSLFNVEESVFDDIFSSVHSFMILLEEFYLSKKRYDIEEGNR